MATTDLIVFISIMAAGVIFYLLLLKSRKRRKKVVAGEDATDVFLRHLDGL